MTSPSRVLAASRTLTAVKGKALRFDGVDDYVDCGNDESLNFGAGDFSLEAWFKTSDSDFQEFLCKKAYGDKGYDLFLDTRILKARIGTPDVIVNVGNYADGLWHHVVAVYDRSSSILVYVDGTHKATSDDISGVTDVSSTFPFKIGVRTDGSEFHGIVDEVRIYERTLNAAEVLYHKEHPYNPILHGCVLWLGHDSIDEGAGIWRDKSGLNNDGVIYGATAVEMNKLAGRVLSV